MRDSFFHLRDATTLDLEAMYELDQLCFAEPFRFDLPTMRRYALKPGAIVLLAHAGSSGDPQLLGFVLVNLLHQRNVHLAYITTLDVHPSHRRRGIAAALMHAAETRAAIAEAAFLRLHVSITNLDAIHFYEQTGYIRHSFVPHFYGEGLHASIYSKPLS